VRDFAPVYVGGHSLRRGPCVSALSPEAGEPSAHRRARRSVGAFGAACGGAIRGGSVFVGKLAELNPQLVTFKGQQVRPPVQSLNEKSAPQKLRCR
jgi:hypothetical protein